ncbi:hypothetical protein BGZ94_008209 [Podila epigama]|nr:hypothetical protein BGZ94_008209 [Podila epigama]
MQQDPSSAFIIVNGVDDRDAGIYSDTFYSHRMSPFRAALRRWLLPIVRGETARLATLQDRWRTPFLDSYFTLTAFAGHPLFFVCTLPIMFWYGHSVFARGFVNVACLGVFITSWIKDYLCLPRPLSPPLVRLSRSKRVYSKLVSIAGLGVYLFSVVFGRLYCGMHSSLDLIAGAMIGVAVWAVQWTFHESIDRLMTSPSWTVVIGAILGGIVLIQSIPETMDSCPCVDDGVTTMAVLMGVFPASQHFAQSKYSVTDNHGHMGIVHYDAALGMPRSIFRFVFGLAIIFTWRLVAKKLLYVVLPPLYKYFNLPPRTHFTPAKTYGNLRNQPIGRVPSVLDLQALSDSSIEIVGPQSTMDIHEKFSQTRSSKRSSLLLASVPETAAEIEAREHFGSKLENVDDSEGELLGQLDASEREALERFELENPGWVRFDVDIVIKTVVYAGIGWLAVDTIPILFEYIGLGTLSL